MRILHLASFDRWTGAAAPAFVEARMLREAGHDAWYGYVGGYLLERKIGTEGWTFPLIGRGRGPVATLRSIATVRRFVVERKVDVVHAHLSHDHWIARAALTGTRGITLARTFHSLRAIRTDPFSRRLIASTRSLAVINAALLEHRALRGRTVRLTPAPLEPQYSPDGKDVRDRYGIPGAASVVGCIGKLSPGRGFEDAIRAFALIDRTTPEAWMLIIGHGPHRQALETLARELGVENRVVWAGYHEEDLPEHFRALDLMMFTASGSDLGHRAIIEANGCGVPVVAYPLPGVEEVLGAQHSRLVSSAARPDALASAALPLLRDGATLPGPEMVRNAARFASGPTVERLLELYGRV